MRDKRIHKITIDNDTIEVEYVFDEETKRWNGNFPVFEDTPKYTPSGRPWKNVYYSGCQYSDSEFGDCGGCSFFYRQKPMDVIAVCFKEELKR